MNILISGGAGFIGSHIAQICYENSHNIYILDNLSSGSLDNLKNINCTFIKKDIRDKDVSEIFEKYNIDIVYHEAAQISVVESINNPMNDLEINLKGLVNLLDNCVKYKVKKFIFASSAAIYGIPKKEILDENEPKNPLSFYALSKKTGEDYIKLYHNLFNLNYIIFRYSNVYGPRQSSEGEAGVVSIFSSAMVNNKDIYIDGDGNQTRDFIYVKDVARANYLALDASVQNEIFNLSTNTKTSINELFYTMKQAFKYEKKVNYREERKGDIKDSRLDNTKLIEKLNFKVEYSLQKGLEEYARSLE